MSTELNLDALVQTALTGQSVTPEQAMSVLTASDEDVLDIVSAASKVRRHFFGNKVKLNYLVPVKSGLCPEDCHYCSQSVQSAAQILRYSWLSREEVTQSVKRGIAAGASTVCLVASGRGPSKRDINRVKEYVRDIRENFPQVNICACLGLIDEEKSGELHDAGVNRYNHNLNTAKSAYAKICSTHTYEDRCHSLTNASGAGLSACSGLIVGMGESNEQIIEVAYALRELDVDSVPVNFLLPFEGTPLEHKNVLNPRKCLRVLAMMRFVHPDTEIRSAAGREYHIRSLQPLALQIANSIFLGDYLTSEGQGTHKDLQMIEDLGFVVDNVAKAEDRCNDCECASNAQTTLEPSLGHVDAAGVRIRQRGVGFEQVRKREKRRCRREAAQPHQCCNE